MVCSTVVRTVAAVLNLVAFYLQHLTYFLTSSLKSTSFWYANDSNRNPNCS